MFYFEVHSRAETGVKTLLDEAHLNNNTCRDALNLKLVKPDSLSSLEKF